jgi:ATP-dependent DNA helicase DinG
MSGLTPKDIGLPLKFSTWRPQQLETVARIAASTKKVVIVQAPMGIGKSLIAAGLQRLTETPLLYTVMTKFLQDQIERDFPYAAVFKGQRNYPCAKWPDRFPLITAAECTKSPTKRVCRGCHYESEWCEDAIKNETACPCIAECEYHIAKKRAIGADLAVLNLPLFLTEANFVGGFSLKSEWTVIDEGDECENALLSFVNIEMSGSVLTKLRISPPSKKTVVASWIDWAKDHAIPVVSERLLRLRNQTAVESMREEKDLERLLRKLKFFEGEASDNWLFMPDEEKSGFVFKPIYVREYAQEFLWKHVKKCLVMSATIIDHKQWCRDMGVDAADAEFIDLMSPFAPEKRKVVYLPSADMTHRNAAESWPRMVKAVDAVLSEYPPTKTLIHTVSYALANAIISRSVHNRRMLSHGSATERDKSIRKFIESGSPLVMVSPSLSRGLDLYGDLCRLNIICKVAYPHLGDKQVAARLYGDKFHGRNWYLVQTVRTIIQQSGRSTRSADDWSVTVILDQQFGRLYSENRRLFPRYWRDALIIPDEETG